MIDFPHISEICTPTTSKVLMLVIDGLGGAAHPERANLSWRLQGRRTSTVWPLEAPAVSQRLYYRASRLEAGPGTSPSSATTR